MWKRLCSLFKKDCRMMMSGKFFLVALGSLVLYTLFINFGYVKFMDAQLYNVYLYDPAGMQTEVSSLVRPVSSLEELNNALASDTNGVGIDASGKTPMFCSMRPPKKQTDTEQTMRCPCFPQMGMIQQKPSAATALK